jgi:putative ABC transport system ATP-binding protein
MSSVRVEDVAKEYALGRTRVQALRGVSLAVEPGEFLAVVGPSGSGKSTLLNLIGCLDHPTSGRVLIGERDVARLGDDALSDLRAETIGFVFQTFNLIPVLSALENVEFPLLFRPRSASRSSPATGPTSCRADSASAWPWRGPWSPTRPSSWPTSPPPTWTPPPARRSSP